MDTVFNEVINVALGAAVPVAIIVCWGFGWVYKSYFSASNKHIPLLVVIVGVTVIFFVNGMAFSVEKVLVPGIVSGAFSAWSYDLLMGYVKHNDTKDTLSKDWKEEK